VCGVFHERNFYVSSKGVFLNFAFKTNFKMGSPSNVQIALQNLGTVSYYAKVSYDFIGWQNKFMQQTMHKYFGDL
jgi:hypothetical protein